MGVIFQGDIWLYQTDLGVKLDFKPGDIILFRSSLLEHFVTDFEGDRSSIVFFYPWEYSKVPKWMKENRGRGMKENRGGRRIKNLLLLDGSYRRSVAYSRVLYIQHISSRYCILGIAYSCRLSGCQSTTTAGFERHGRQYQQHYTIVYYICYATGPFSESSCVRQWGTDFERDQATQNPSWCSSQCNLSY